MSVRSTAPTSVVTNELVVMTLNMWNSDHMRFERAHRVVEELAHRRPHLIALQEISIPHDMALWMANRLNEWTYDDEYTAYSWNKIGPQGAHEGLAILTCLPLVGPSEALDLRGGGRLAHRIKVRFGSTNIGLCNVHFHHPINASSMRLSQARLVADWMTEFGDCARIIAGDFNDFPTSETMSLLFNEWSSAYSEFHGAEPDHTFPSPAVQMDNEWYRPRVTDYVLFDRTFLSISHAELVFSEMTDNADLHPSDHFGILVRLRLSSTSEEVKA